jgi:hypothetical protein
MILLKQFYWLSCGHLTFRKIWYCLIKTPSLDGIWTHTIDTLQHHSLSLMSSALDHSNTSTPYIYIRLKIKPNGVRIRFLSCQIFVLPLALTGFELAPLIHCSTLRPALSTTSTPCIHVYTQRKLDMETTETSISLITYSDNSFLIILLKVGVISLCLNFQNLLWFCLISCFLKFSLGIYMYTGSGCGRERWT